MQLRASTMPGHAGSWFQRGRWDSLPLSDLYQEPGSLHLSQFPLLVLLLLLLYQTSSSSSTRPGPREDPDHLLSLGYRPTTLVGTTGPSDVVAVDPEGLDATGHTSLTRDVIRVDVVKRPCAKRRSEPCRDGGPDPSRGCLPARWELVPAFSGRLPRWSCATLFSLRPVCCLFRQGARTGSLCLAARRASSADIL